ncbi:hypothetical protein GURASL_13470 [Geotalea uraniireducens]|uniref:Uncharacterized protein n=1 Tax=Geotalea uraniireducens TaxID=351604 RepID=A0ABM8EKA0_9BACT|nr:hypothetical protein [Geotalea uraniireducens]BDV42424.1 hypothetical protein GURASL_13470 [Geotalea uraniireducens]
MAAGWVGLITTALTLLASVLGWAVKNKETRDARTYDNDTAHFDEALATRDTDDLSRMFDELRVPGTEGSDDPGRSEADASAGR